MSKLSWQEEVLKDRRQQSKPSGSNKISQEIIDEINEIAKKTLDQQLEQGGHQ